MERGYASAFRVPAGHGQKDKNAGGPSGLINQVTGLLGGRGGGRTAGNGGIAGKATSFVSGFLSGGDSPKGGRRGRAGRGGRRRR